MRPNRLAAERSLYLRQHGRNPVDWYPWGDEALDKAVREDKMIFLSIGYSSCHWCHVMERESFEDPAVAAVLNARFISVKVDREERPDLDQIYMEAVQMMSGQGGWPLNVWLTPALEPVYGGTYFPPDASHNRPSFRMVLERLHEMWTNERGKLTDRASHIRTYLEADLAAHLDPADPSPALIDQAVTQILSRYDAVHGGFGDAPKFPMAMLVRFMLQTEAGREAALHSLRRMCEGGIRDQLGGGFHRYSTDSEWLVPHFEKMLYDQALMIRALAEAVRHSDDPVFARALADTGTFLDREMRLPEGGYGSALDADNGGVEGEFYTWTPTELRAFGCAAQANWEGRVILEGRLMAGWSPETIRTLSNVRASKSAPAFDPKFVTGWNALLLIGFCDAADATDDAVWKERATALAGVLLGCADPSGRVRHERDVEAVGFATDHALLALGFCRMHERVPSGPYMAAATAIGRQLAGRFLDMQTGTVFFAEPSADRLVRRKDWFDHAEPSANSAAIAAFRALAHLTGDPTFGDPAKAGLRRIHDLLVQESLSMGFALETALGEVRRAAEATVCAVDGSCAPPPADASTI
jgi:uncharacterized protein YyaL (SSP411 family)